MLCKICQSPTEYYASSFVMAQRFSAKYLRCIECEYLFVENPHWLELAYKKSINDSDVGLVDRNFRFSTITASLIKFFFNSKGKFLDYAGGYGLFVRLIRNLGFNFYWMDKYSENLFAQRLEHNGQEKKYELLTAFEVFEHLYNPMKEMEEMLTYSENIFLSTELLPSHNPKPEEWDYFGTEHGQHIGIFSLKALKVMAKKFGLNCYSNGVDLHLFTKKKIPLWLYKFCITYRYVFLIRYFLKSNSLEHIDRKNTLKALASENVTHLKTNSL